jgi:hypothetical protein
MADQLPIQFKFKELLPKTKVPISKERIEEAKKLYASGNARGSLEILRDVREGLERYCNRIKNG